MDRRRRPEPQPEELEARVGDEALIAEEVAAEQAASGSDELVRDELREAGGDDPPDADDDELLLDGPLELDHDELLAGSEYNVRMAHRDPLSVTSGGNRRLGVHVEEDISVQPEELGRRALEEATQDFHSRTEDDDLPEADWPGLRWGEGQIVESVLDDEAETDRLLTHYGERGEAEAEQRISDEAEQELERRLTRRRPR